ncbi:hypothetical protein OG800_49745 (plasmid) [Streptomyces sp. NBC_00445]|uniref:hypothetical protein n=1 Tax=Streptomyces sp. NBC_00445 TaxID=2975745 RepID=UPI002E1ACFBA
METVTRRGLVGLREKPLSHAQLSDRPAQAPPAQKLPEVALLQGKHVRSQRPQELHLPDPPIGWPEPKVCVSAKEGVERDNPQWAHLIS